MADSFRAFVDEMLATGKNASVNCAKHNTEFIPTFIALCDGGIIPMPMPHYVKDRATHISLMKAMIAEFKADAFAFVMEAWFSQPEVKKGKPVTSDDYVMPSKDPNRKECVLVHAASRDGREHCLMVEINRHGHKLTFGKEWDMAERGEGKSMMAVMSNMFGKETVN